MVKHRGHPIEQRGDIFVYRDTGQPVPDNKDRDCGHCGLANTPEGHDGCLGTLPGVMNACCGHGGSCDRYVQWPDRSSIHGDEAERIQAQMVEARDGR